MPDCCIAGCFNRPTKERTLKFYTIPTANSVRPFKVNRRRLWLEAIEKANGSVADLSSDSRICSAHFISGQFSLDNSNPDFVPSVFPNLQRSKPNKGTRLRPCTPSKASYVKLKKKTPRTRKKPLEEVHLLNNTVLMETDQCEEEKQKATSSTLTEDEEVLQEEDEIKLSSVLGTADLSPPKKPILLLTSVVDTSGGFRCEVCNRSFTDGSVLAKHKELHDQEMSGEEKLPTPFEVYERRTNIESDVSDRHCVEDPSFKCNMCDRSFPTIHNLKRHKLLHVRDARKCTQCGTLFCKRHNNVFFRPQISTETNFEEDTVTGDTLNVPSKNQSPESSYSDDLEFIENTIEAGEPTLAKEEQCKAFTAIRPNPGPAFTCKPQKPDLLASFVSFISTSKAQPQPSKAIQPKQRRSTDLVATQPVPEPSTSLKLDAVKVFNNSSTKPEKSYTFIATTSKPGSSPVKTATSPNPPLRHSIKLPLVKQSTASLSVSKPLPSDVLKAFMSFICKTESTRSSVPRLITFRQTDPIATPPKPGPSTTFVPDMSTTPAMQTKLTHKRHAFAMAGYVHGSRPPSPEPILDKRRRGPWEASSLHHPRDFVQPHLPQTPVLPPALQMFSPQYLTSAMLDVERNYRYILSKV